MVTGKEIMERKSSPDSKTNLNIYDKSWDLVRMNPQQIVDEARISLGRRNIIISKIYRDHTIKRIVKGTLMKMGCNQSDCDDCFSEAVVNFIKACYRPNFELKSSLSNYLTGIAKNIWLKEVTKRKKESTIIQNIKFQKDEEKSVEVILIDEERKKYLQMLLDQLDESCQKVLTLWSFKKRMKEIAMDMGYKSEGMARKKKHHCLRKLYEIIDRNPAFKEQLRSD